MTPSAPKALQPRDGRVLRVLGNTFTLKVTAADTNDAYSVFEIASPPNNGIPPHTNTRESETHVILQGKYSFRLGAQTYEAEPGAAFFVPRGTLHAFQNVGREEARLLLIPSPGSNNEALVVKLAERFGPGPLSSTLDPADLQALAALAAEHGVEPSIPG